MDAHAARMHRWLIPLAALVAVAPLLLGGPSCGHDFDFHLLSWLEAATQLSHGAFPHWAYTPGWNAGEPRFLFYPPLSWLGGALLGIALPWSVVPAALTWICLTLSGFAMHFLAKSRMQGANASLAAVLYLANPYMLFTAYERTAYGELLAAAFVPLLLAALGAWSGPARLRALAIAGSVALVWLSNAPAGVMVCYAVLFLTCVQLLLQLRRSRRAALRETVTIGGGTLLGLALAGAYLVPATYQQRFISAYLATVEGMRIEDNTLFHHMRATVATGAGDADLHNSVLATASIVAVLLLVSVFGAAALLLWRKHSVPSSDRRLILLAVLVLFLLTPAALPLWHLLPEMRFLQFPWRLLLLVAPTAALLIARCLPVLNRPGFIACTALVLVIALVAPAWQVFQQPCDPEDAVPARVALFHSSQGTDPTDEYTPADADGDALRPGEPPFWLVSDADVRRGAPVNALPSGLVPGGAPAELHLHLHLTEPEYLVLHRRQYPIWQLRLNGKPVAPYAAERTDGLITLALPAGEDDVQLREVRTPDEDAGLALCTAAGVVSVALWRRRTARPDGSGNTGDTLPETT